MVKALKLALLVLIFSPFLAKAATLSVSPASGSFEVGDRVTIRAVVSSATPINAISGELSIPTSVFAIDSVSKAGSLLNFWVTEPSFSQAGLLHFEGVTLGGYSGGTATVVTVVLRAVKEGSGVVSFRSGTVLANDGQGTDVTDGLSGATYSVTAASKEVKPSVALPVELPQPAATLSAPEITLTSRFAYQAISGKSSYPKADVLLAFADPTGVKVFITGETDQAGHFIMDVPRTLRHGIYKVTAVVIRGDFSHSPESNELTIKVGNFLSDIGWGIRIAMLLIILLFIYLLIRTYQHFKRGRKAEELVHKSFKLLHEDVDDLSDEQSNATNKKHLKEINREMAEAEDLIIKEIKDIETP